MDIITPIEPILGKPPLGRELTEQKAVERWRTSLVKALQEIYKKARIDLTTIVEEMRPVNSCITTYGDLNPATLGLYGTWTKVADDTPVAGCYLWRRSA